MAIASGTDDKTGQHVGGNLLRIGRGPERIDRTRFCCSPLRSISLLIIALTNIAISNISPISLLEHKT
jgi:hypothetical protein